MTWWLGRQGFGEAPTSAIVRVSARICSGVRTRRYSTARSHGRRSARNARPRELRAVAASTGQSYPGPVLDEIRVACVQLTSRADKSANLEKTERLVARAAATGADVVVLPEKWNAIGNAETLYAAAEPLEGGESVEAMRAWARGHGITLVGGSITERRDEREKLSNTSLVFDGDGELAAVYRKIHLFDVEVGGHVYRESEAEEAGEEAVVAQLDGWPIGLSICYDLRFAGLYSALSEAGAVALAIPAAFTVPTGDAHWHVLVRARAIESSCFAIAAAQCGLHEDGRRTYGHSLVVDPWGRVLLDMGTAERETGFAELDLSQLGEVRRRLPSLRHRRRFALPG